MTTMDRIDETRKGRRRGAGSALILTVVLTSLLAIVGVLFLMASRIDKMATMATADNRQLGFAVDSVVARIGEVLAQDVPGASNGQEYYDYPDANNVWLADLEPYMTAGDPNFYWQQVSNVAGGSVGSTRRVLIRIVGEREPVDLTRTGTNADADGDGVGDARWFAVPGITSSKGDSIYAAVRIVDNSAMLNVNTGYKFDPQDPNRLHVDGHSQLQVNVLALACKRGDLPAAKDEAGLLSFRANKSPTAAANLANYELQETWQYQSPSDVYTPFDLSDELELRYRYLLNQEGIDTRVEDWGWFRPPTVFSTPVDANLGDWFMRATGVRAPASPKAVDPNAYYSYRHMATTYNLDRILMPQQVSTGEGMEPGRMVNVNTANRDAIIRAVTAALAGVNLVNIADPTQIIVNILDYIDDDDQVTVLQGSSASNYYGFERPCIYLSELAYRFVRDASTNTVHKSYAIELCKPYFEDNDPRPGEWQIVIDNPSVTQVITWSGTRQFHVLLAEDSQAALESGYVSFKDMDAPVDAASLPRYDPAKYSHPSTQALDSAGFSSGATITLQRKVKVGGQDQWMTVDLKKVPAAFMQNAEDGAVHRLQRDVSKEHCILRLWGPPPSSGSGASLGDAADNYVSDDTRKLQAHPANRTLVNIGELGRIFAWSAYNIPDPEQATPAAESLLIDLANPVYENLFNYLTVIDPVNHSLNPLPSEMRVKGRINVNTAPAFVLAQLPWMQYNDPTLKKAQAIVNYRNDHGAFKTIGGLMQVQAMWQLASDGINNLYDVPTTGPTRPRGPDLTPDTVTDDIEERDLIFTRISDLVTVRSDVFTAYVLVRLGMNGPQKRVIAILDRGMTRSAKDPVRVVSLEQVPDPR